MSNENLNRELDEAYSTFINCFEGGEVLTRERLLECGMRLIALVTREMYDSKLFAS